MTHDANVRTKPIQISNTDGVPCQNLAVISEIYTKGPQVGL